MTVYFIADHPFNRHHHPHLIGYGYDYPVPYAAIDVQTVA